MNPQIINNEGKKIYEKTTTKCCFLFIGFFFLIYFILIYLFKTKQLFFLSCLRQKFFLLLMIYDFLFTNIIFGWRLFELIDFLVYYSIFVFCLKKKKKKKECPSSYSMSRFDLLVTVTSP